MSSQLLKAAKKLTKKGFLVGIDGNLSFRLQKNKTQDFLTLTPSGVEKAKLKKTDLIEFQQPVNTSDYPASASSETPMHLAVYQNCPQAQVVIHAHPPQVVAWSLVHLDQDFLPINYLSELILATGPVPHVPFELPGSQTLAQRISTYLPKHQCLILARHGVLVWGKSFEEALRGIDRLDYTCGVYLQAESTGRKLEPLNSIQMKELQKIRNKIGQQIL